MEHLKLKGEKMEEIQGLDLDKLNNLARFVRGFAFAALEASHSGHPGGSSSKTEQLVALLASGVFNFDPLDPKNPNRDRLVWSAGHCTPLLHGVQAMVYEALKKAGKDFDPKELHAVMAKDLLRFRHVDGPAGHAESYYPFSDLCTGASGHGLSGALGLATLHQSSGLDTKVFTLMGDAETEEGMTYEARNIAKSLNLKNLVVSLDYNHYGIDGDINEVISSEYINHWLGLGWNVIEVDGHNILELIHAYRKAVTMGPCVVLAHCIKGKFYGQLENTADSHGKPADTEEYATIMKNLKFEISGEVAKDVDLLVEQLPEEDAKYLADIFANSPLPTEEENLDKMKKALGDRPLVKPKDITRPETMPKELVFTEPTATRKATDAFYTWLMSQTAFFYAGTGDLSKSILTKNAEDAYGIINKDNPYGRGIRFGIAEQNMAMLSCALTQDILPGGYQGVSTFSSYGVFTSMMANSVRMSLIGNAINPKNNGFFILLAAHDGPETGEDGPTHHGLFWMSLYTAYPGIKVYKPMDANETIEMLFHAFKKQEPIALSVARPDTEVFDRTKHPAAKLACQGAYTFKDYAENGKEKIVLAVCGGQTMANTLEALPEIEAEKDVKIIAVTSPELYEEFAKENPSEAEKILSDEERSKVVALHNGWPGFLYPFILPSNYKNRALGMDRYLKSGPPQEVYKLAGFTAKDIKEKVLKAL